MGNLTILVAVPTYQADEGRIRALVLEDAPCLEADSDFDQQALVAMLADLARSGWVPLDEDEEEVDLLPSGGVRIWLRPTGGPLAIVHPTTLAPVVQLAQHTR